MSEWRIVAAGDACVSVEFPAIVDETVNRRVVALAQLVDRARPRGVRDVVPGFYSMAVYFDPMTTDRGALTRWLDKAAGESASHTQVSTGTVDIPVEYRRRWRS